MDEKELNKFRRHVNKATRHIFTNAQGEKDEFEFKPLGVKYLPDFIKIFNASKLRPDEQNIKNKLISDCNKGVITQDECDRQIEELEVTASMRAMEGEAAETLLDLIFAMVKNSYPDLDDGSIWDFINGNFHKLEIILMETNESVFSKDAETLNKVQEMKARLKNAKT